MQFLETKGNNPYEYIINIIVIIIIIIIRSHFCSSYFGSRADRPPGPPPPSPPGAPSRLTPPKTMHKFTMRMPTRANYLNANDITGVFRLLDKDGSGKLNGDEVQDMFNQVCGQEVSVNGGMGEYTLKQFQCVVEDTEARYPQFKVAENLMNYLKDMYTYIYIYIYM